MVIFKENDVSGSLKEKYCFSNENELILVVYKEHNQLCLERLLYYNNLFIHYSNYELGHSYDYGDYKKNGIAKDLYYFLEDCHLKGKIEKIIT